MMKKRRAEGRKEAAEMSKYPLVRDARMAF